VVAKPISEIDAVAKAIRFLVPLDHGPSKWTDYGLSSTDWPDDFSEFEQNLLMRIAQVALWAAQRYREDVRDEGNE
jgi:hypothetical protein